MKVVHLRRNACETSACSSCGGGCYGHWCGADSVCDASGEHEEVSCVRCVSAVADYHQRLQIRARSLELTNPELFE